jgi:RNA polymerase sigma-54 factor
MIGESLGVHESTVSRATAHKYIQTPRGLFEMKYFFTAAIPSADSGEVHSAEAVRQRIRQMIEEEDPDDILSDDGIVERLRKADIVVARRTVAKYRDSLKIPSSVERRKLKMSPIAPPRARSDSVRAAGLSAEHQTKQHVAAAIDTAAAGS